MTSLDGITWLNDAQRKILGEFHIRSWESLASFELRDSFADVIPLPELRQMAKKAREALGREDPLSELDQAAGHHGPVRRAGGKEANG